MENKPDFDNIVFEDRNKAYGAYHLRRFYKNSVLLGFIIGTLVISAALAAPLAFEAFAGEKEEETGEKVITVVMEQLPEPPPPEEIKAPEPPPEIATIKNLELEPKPDNEVKKEELPPSKEEAKDKQSGNETKDGANTTPVTPDVPPVVKPPVVDPVVTWAPEMPEFPGGPSELLKFFGRHLEYTPRAEEAGIEGTVKVQFIVNTDGSISDVKIVSQLGYGLDEEVLKAFKKMPKWKPARKGGKEVRLRMTTPVVFSLEDE